MSEKGPRKAQPADAQLFQPSWLKKIEKPSFIITEGKKEQGAWPYGGEVWSVKMELS